jgi:hypothetical protein
MKIFDGEREVIYGSSVKFRGGRLTSPLWPTHIVLFLVLLACLLSIQWSIVILLFDN